ncbi:MAG TPA: CaiB/BaiF CoA-transferase family protein [Dehalococcoidia bacterium]
MSGGNGRGALDGVRVLDFTWALAGPFCTMILADLGAEVIKVEHPGLSERERGFGPHVQDVSTFFFSTARGKKSVTIDLKTKEGRELVRGLARRADVLVENFTPGTMDRLGIGYQALARENPRLIYCGISGFGRTGPYRDRGGVDIIVQAMGGMMSITGEPDGPPMRVGASIGDTTAGLFAAIGVLAALRERDRSGRGQLVDIGMLDCQLAILENAIIRYAATGQVPGRIGTRHPLVTPFQAFQTRDGWLVVAGVKDWQLFCARLGRDDLGFDPRFQSNGARTAHHAELEPLLQEVFRTRTTDEWLAELGDVALVAPVNTIDRVYRDPHVAAREMLVELPLPGGREGTLTVPNSPVKMSRTPGRVRGTAPALGQHNQEVLTGLLGLSPERVQALKEAGVI